MNIETRLDRLEKNSSPNGSCICAGQVQTKPIFQDYATDESVSEMNRRIAGAQTERCGHCGKLRYANVVGVEFVTDWRQEVNL